MFGLDEMFSERVGTWTHVSSLKFPFIPPSTQIPSDSSLTCLFTTGKYCESTRPDERREFLINYQLLLRANYSDSDSRPTFEITTLNCQQQMFP
jgi:hypothetical protein